MSNLKSWGKVRETKGKVYLAFYGCGKTYFAKKTPNYIDIEFSWFKQDKELLIHIIKSYTTVYGYNVLLTLTPQSAKLLKEHNIEFVGILPTVDMRDEFIERYNNRGDRQKALNYFYRIYEPMLIQLEKLDFNKVHLEPGQYFEDIIGELE